jgi:hypothetical protein
LDRLANFLKHDSASPKLSTRKVQTTPAYRTKVGPVYKYYERKVEMMRLVKELIFVQVQNPSPTENTLRDIPHFFLLSQNLPTSFLLFRQ